MKFLGGIFLLAGYMLVYAAAAKGGQFATDPWTGLFADAYEGFGGMVGGTIAGVGSEIGSAVTSVANAVGGTPGGVKP